MSLLPDEIARRSFTPSADGYHQGEVRAFLERMAREQRALLASMPEGQRLVVDLTMAVAAQETRLERLEQRLEATVAQLETVAVTVQRTQDRAIQQLAVASRVAGEQQQLLNELGEAVRTMQQSAAAEPAGAAPATAAPATAAVDTAAPATAAAPPPAEPTPTAAIPETVPTPAEAPPLAAMTTNQPARHALSGSRNARIRPSAATAAPSAAAPAATTPAAASPTPQPPPAHTGGDSIPEGVIGVRLMRAAPPTQPTPTTTTTAPNPPTQPSPTTTTAPNPPTQPAPAALLAAIDEQEPLITDSANDLLDGVLDDVMENITERPSTS